MRCKAERTRAHPNSIGCTPYLSFSYAFQMVLQGHARLRLRTVALLRCRDERSRLAHQRGPSQLRKHLANVSNHQRLDDGALLRMNRSRLDRAMTAPAPAPSVPMLLAKLVELGREAWRIHEQERAVRAKIQALQEIEEKQ